MPIYDIFAVTAVFIGLHSGVFLLRRAWANRKSVFWIINLGCLAITCLYLAVIYAWTITTGVNQTLTIGVYIRPAVIILLLIPSEIVRRMRI